MAEWKHSEITLTRAGRLGFGAAGASLCFMSVMLLALVGDALAAQGLSVQPVAALSTLAALAGGPVAYLQAYNILDWLQQKSERTPGPPKAGESE
jgi:hypothetical protein